MSKLPVIRHSLFAILERWVWYLFVATAAWQTRLILWQADTRFIEWRAASLYASDVLMVALFVLAVVGAKGWFVRRMDAADWLLGFFVAVAVLSLAHADQLTVGIYQLLRLAQGILLYLYLRHWAWNRFDADRTTVAFVVGALLQASLGITQYVLQHDAGLRWLGESVLRTDMRGVAVFYDTHYLKILRAYGTFPHPNVLAAYLMTTLWIVGWLWLCHGDSNSPAIRYSLFTILPRLVWPATTALLLWGLYLTFSRTVIVVWLAASIAVALILIVRRISGRWPNIKTVRRRAFSMAVTVLAVSVCFVVFLWPTVVARMTISVSDEAVRLRIKYNDDAITSGAGLSWRINWTGVGIGNFTTWLSRYDTSMPSFMYQPAHNIYLMVYSETGLLGLLFWLAWLGLIIRTTWRAHASQPVVRAGVLALLGSVLVIGLLDHFYWTLQQGRLLWWSALALAAGKANSE